MDVSKVDQILAGVKRIHCIGIKGTGLSSLAVNLKNLGFEVSGSDSPESFFTDELLEKNDINVYTSFDSSHITNDIDLIITSTAYGDSNPEIAEAKKRSLKIMTYPEVIGLLSKSVDSIAIAGSHGKTTTSGLLSFIVSQSELNPLVNVGSIVPQLLDYKPRDPNLFIFEADEYQNKFQYYFPKILIITNLDYDHPDFFLSKESYIKTFSDFIGKLPADGILVYCTDDNELAKIAKQALCKTIGYGLKNSDYGVSNINLHEGLMTFNITNTPIKSQLLGQHNALNITAAWIVAQELGIKEEEIRKSIANFIGTKRRMEKTLETKINDHQVIVIDDFAHHPTEIRATLSTIRQAYPNKTIWTVFQPHTFSRTQALFDEFVTAFKDSDHTILLDIYGSKREQAGTLTTENIVEAMHRNDPEQSVEHCHDIAAAAEKIKNAIASDSVLITMGATEIWRLKDLI